MDADSLELMNGSDYEIREVSNIPMTSEQLDGQLLVSDSVIAKEAKIKVELLDIKLDEQSTGSLLQAISNTIDYETMNSFRGV